jgi:hypothetical protein
MAVEHQTHIGTGDQSMQAVATAAGLARSTPTMIAVAGSRDIGGPG